MYSSIKVMQSFLWAWIVRCLIILVCLLTSLNPGKTCATEMNDLNLIPIPKKVVPYGGVFSLDSGSTILAEDKVLLPLTEILLHHIYLQTGLKVSQGKSESIHPSIILRINPELASEAYVITVKDSVMITGHDYRAVAWGGATLLQLIQSNGGKFSLPCLEIQDSPDYEFRSVMIDLARRPHPIGTVKDTINLYWLYKIKYMHLHLSDNQSTVFTSRSLPKLATPKVAFSIEEWKDIVRFADERGVTIIPEIDVPGHAGSWVRKMPELFGTTDPKTGEARSLGIVNMANEKAYEALDLLVGDLVDVFASSPFIQIGTDEVGAGGLMKLPEYQPYCEKHGLKRAQEGHAHELFLHFIERMNTIVRSHGKQAIAWNDFGGASTPNVKIPTNLVTMVWTGSPLTMVERGYPIINCCWLPLYIVPPQQRAPEDYRIYDWQVRSFRRWSDQTPMVLADDTPIMGAQICFWEQRYNEVIPILRSRLPAFSERLWHEKAGRTFDDFKKRRLHTERVVQKNLYPVTFDVQGLIDEKDVCFEDKLTIRLYSTLPGAIRYTLKNEWEHFPVATSEVYTGPLTLNETMTVSARLYDSDGYPVGGIRQHRFRKMIPAYTYRVLGPTPPQGWKEMPDFASLEELQTGVTGLMDKDRSFQINRSMFARLQPYAHVDVRVHNVYNPLTLELTGQCTFPVDGEYAFKLRSHDGLSELYIGDSLVTGVKVSGREYVTTGTIKAGTYPLSIKHFFRSIKNELNILVKTPGSSQFESFENLVVPISKWVGKTELSGLSADCVFEDPIKKANMNLATDKPVTVSGGTQGAMVPSNAVDGVTDNSSGWHAGSHPQWLQVDLGKVYRVGRVKLYTYYDGRRYYQYTIEASWNGTVWQPIVDMTKNVEPSTKEGDEHNVPPVQARYIKVNMLNNSANPGVHINELMVYELEN